MKNHLQDNEVTYVYDVVSKEIDFQFPEEMGSWHVTSDEKLIEYYYIFSVVDPAKPIYAYDLESNKFLFIGNFENQGYLYAPKLSNSGNSLIGIVYQSQQTTIEDYQWYFIDTETMIAEPLRVPENIVATESISWAPDDALVALVGFYRDEGSGADAGTLVCGRVAVIYDPIAQSTIQVINMPDKRCVPPFAMYSFYSDKYYWSPDGSKLAMVLDQQDICIIDVLNKVDECKLITNNYGTEIGILGLAWSPDIKYLAYIISGNDIQVLSLEDETIYSLANIVDLSTFPLRHNLVWGR